LHAGGLGIENEGEELPLNKFGPFSNRQFFLTVALVLTLGVQVIYQLRQQSFFPLVDYDMFARGAAGESYSWYFLSVVEPSQTRRSAFKVNRDLAPLHIRGFVRLMNERTPEQQAILLGDLKSYLESKSILQPEAKLVWNRFDVDIESYHRAEMAMPRHSVGAVPTGYDLKVEKISESP
jgi:hypothetical protein